MSRNRTRLPTIIDRSDLVSPRKRRIGQVISVVAWGVWIYLFMPLIALVGWSLGVGLFERYILDDPLATLETVQVYALIIVAAGIVFITWAGYNWLRFHGHERRHAPQPVGTNDLARRFCITPAEAETVEHARIVTVHFNDYAEITAIERPSPGEQRPG